ncbi:MAG: dienelactone hydrolase family protein [Planctomycetes bacterium]|nr:dienelactone hydrolase family protein [Planctomycetota bacterium]
MYILTGAVSCFLAGMALAEDGKKIAAPYAVAHAAPLEAKEEVVAETEEYTQLRVEFNGIKGDRVPGFLYLPKKGPSVDPANSDVGQPLCSDPTPTRGAGARRPAVLLQYGSGGNKKTNYIVAIGRQFASHGFVVLTIDAPLKGERKQAEKKQTDWLFSTEGRQNFLQYCGDYSRAVDFLESRSEVDRERIGYVGISWGAITGVTYVAHDARIKAMASIVGGGGFLGLARSLAAKPADSDPAGPVSIDPVHHVGLIAPRPLLLLNVTKDQLVPRPFAEALHKAAGEGSKVVWLETDHLFSGMDLQEVGESVIRFMEEALVKPSSTPSREGR